MTMVIIGRLTKDAVLAQLKDERKVANFTIALNDYYKPKGSAKGVTVTTYVSCAYWINPSIAAQLRKGSLLEISGRFYVNAYTNMQGEAKASLNCHVSSIKVHQWGRTEVANTVPEHTQLIADDLPF